METKTLAIFINEYYDSIISDMDIIINSFREMYDDLTIISDKTVNVSEKYSTIPSFFLPFFRGDVVFLSLSGYLEYRDILAENIFINTNIKELLSNNITRSAIGSSVKIISINDLDVEVINYATI